MDDQQLGSKKDEQPEAPLRPRLELLDGLTERSATLVSAISRLLAGRGRAEGIAISAIAALVVLGCYAAGTKPPIEASGVLAIGSVAATILLIVIVGFVFDGKHAETQKTRSSNTPESRNDRFGEGTHRVTSSRNGSGQPDGSHSPRSGGVPSSRRAKKTRRKTDRERQDR